MVEETYGLARNLLPPVAAHFGVRAAVVLAVLGGVVLLATTYVSVRARGSKEKVLEEAGRLAGRPWVWVIAGVFAIAFVVLGLTFKPFEFRDVMAVRCSDGSVLVGAVVTNEMGEVVEGTALSMVASEDPNVGDGPTVTTTEKGFLEVTLYDLGASSGSGPIELEISYKWFPRTLVERIVVEEPMEFAFSRPAALDSCTEGDQLCAEGTFAGEMEVCSTWSLWVFATDKFENHYLQSPRVKLHSSGTWQAQNVRPGADVIGLELVWVPGDAEYMIERAINDAEWRFSSLPEGSLTLAVTPMTVEPAEEETESEQDEPDDGDQEDADEEEDYDEVDTWTPWSEVIPHGPAITDHDFIWELAREYGYDNTGGNYAPTLYQGDVLYWAGLGQTEPELRREFELRGIIIELAEEKQIAIPSTGDLSNWANTLEDGMPLDEIEERMRSEP